MDQTEEKKERKLFKWIAYFLWFSFFAGIIFSAITFTVIARGDLPTFEDLENPKYDLASLVYDTDAFALFRVMFKTLLFQQESSGGGSTISQQLAKLLYKRASLRGRSTLGRALGLATVKFKEWITAVKLERSYTKEEILIMYLNKFEFINGAHGIQAAAQVYFGKDQKYLRIEEASMLVGMLVNPARNNPNRFPERTKERRKRHRYVRI